MKKFICCLLIIIGVINLIYMQEQIYALAASENETEEFIPTPLVINTNNVTTNSIPISTIQEELYKLENNTEVIDDVDGTVAYTSAGVVDMYNGEITEYTDLQNRMDINVDQMNAIIEYWLDGRESEFTNQGQTFIDAANITGLDPIFLLALAAQESGWEVSDLHSGKNNPYSINMVDHDPTLGYHMGEAFEDGIINGAIWVKDNYYNSGQTNLYSMIYGAKCYSSSTDSWINSIRNIMRTSYRYILNY